MFFTVASPLALPGWKAVCARTFPRPDFELLDLHGGVVVFFYLNTKWVASATTAQGCKERTAWAGCEVDGVVASACGRDWAIPTRSNHMTTSTSLSTAISAKFHLCTLS